MQPTENEGRLARLTAITSFCIGFKSGRSLRREADEEDSMTIQGTEPATSIGEYLIARLQALGLTDMFGIPGDFILGFYGLLERKGVRVVGTCNELNAGYAADAYARLRGIGAVCVTYNVGGLSLVNAVAGAYAEKSPLVVISGAPGVAEREGDPLLHHRVGPFTTQRDVFGHVTVAAVALDDPVTAFREIDRALELCVTRKLPIYFELPRDRVASPPVFPHLREPRPSPSDEAALEEALADAGARLAGAARAVIVAGLEVHRCGLRREVEDLAVRQGIPVCATNLAKSVISERHPMYLGVYEGAMGREDVREAVEGSDCVILLGAFLTDFELGSYTAKLDPARWVFASLDDLRISHHHYQGVQFADFVRGLAALPPPAVPRAMPKPRSEPPAPFMAQPGVAVTVRRLLARVDAMLDPGWVVVCDVGDALFGASELHTCDDAHFMGPAYYTSMGFAVPAAIAVQVARPDLRPLVLVGDGAFQMTGQELSTAARLGLDPIVIVQNNRGYTTERYLQEGSFNDIHEWRYHELPALLGAGRGFDVRTEDELDAALRAAAATRGAFSILNVHLDTMDVSPTLGRLAAGVREKMARG